jgi:L-asparaginase II
MNDNPVLIEVMRGARVESRHHGAVAVADAEGRLLLALGDVARPVFPRSAVKALQAIPLVESGAADAFGLGTAELAIACASHSGETIHIEAARSLLVKAGADESLLACGPHWPLSESASRGLLAAGEVPRPIHNNCSGKHAGMLATALHLGLRPQGYERPDHPVQLGIARIISELCGIMLRPEDVGIDGCSVPTFALPLDALAAGFARFGSGSSRGEAARELMQACFAAPVLVAGNGRFDTTIMQRLAPAAFIKGGAEGVHCAALPQLGLGIAVKIDDGAKRGAEATMAQLLAALIPKFKSGLARYLDDDLHNWHGQKVGRIAAAATLTEGIARIAERHDFAANRMHP